jgi:hypothetical protein
VAGLAAIVAVGLAPGVANAAPVQSGGIYKLFAAHTSNHGLKVLDVANASSANGTPVNIFQSHDGLNQRWRVIQTGALPFSGTPVYSLQPQNAPNKCLDIFAASTEAGARAQIFDCHFGPNQQFFIEDLSPSTDVKRLVARHSGLRLDVFGANTANGTPVQQFFATEGANQKWAFVRVG